MKVITNKVIAEIKWNKKNIQPRGRKGEKKIEQRTYENQQHDSRLKSNHVGNYIKCN